MNEMRQRWRKTAKVKSANSLTSNFHWYKQNLKVSYKRTLETKYIFYRYLKWVSTLAYRTIGVYREMRQHYKQDDKAERRVKEKEKKERKIERERDGGRERGSIIAMLVQSIVVTTSIISTLNWLTAWRPLIGCTRNLQRLTAFLAGKPNLNLIGGDGGPLPNRTARSCDTPSPSIYGAIDSFRRLIITPILVLSTISLVWTGNNPAKIYFPLLSNFFLSLSLSLSFFI